MADFIKTDDDCESLGKTVDRVFDNFRDFSFSTSYLAKEVILNADKLGVTPTEYLNAVSDWVDKFYKNINK